MTAPAPEKAARLDTLRALKERVDAAEGEDRGVDGDIAVTFLNWSFKKMKGDARAYWRRPEYSDIFYMREEGGPPRFTSSIDAALALVERVLPATPWVIYAVSGGEDPNRAYRVLVVLDRVEHLGFSREAACAILSALLSALISREEDHD